MHNDTAFGRKSDLPPFFSSPKYTPLQFFLTLSILPHFFLCQSILPPFFSFSNYPPPFIFSFDLPSPHCRFHMYITSSHLNECKSPSSKFDRSESPATSIQTLQVPTSLHFFWRSTYLPPFWIFSMKFSFLPPNF